MTVTHRTRIAAASVALLMPMLAACSTSFGAQTDKVYNPTRGVEDRSGRVDVLHALVVSGTDGEGTVVATLVNNDRAQADQLLGVTVDGQQARIAKPAEATEIAPLYHNNLGTSGAVTAEGDDIVPGNFVEVTFTFAHGEAITLQAPVVPAEGDYADVPLKSDS